MIGGRRACGHSLVIDPWGNNGGSRGREETLVVELDLERVEEVRREFGVFPDRRPDVYHLQEKEPFKVIRTKWRNNAD